MGLIAAIFISFGGIAFFLLLVQAFTIFRRGKDKLFLAGMVISAIFLMYITSVLIASNYNDFLENFTLVLKLQLVFMQLLLFALFSSFYLQVHGGNRLYYRIGLAFFSISTLVSISLPLRLLFGDNIGLNLVVLETNERFLMISPVLTAWRGIIDISIVAYALIMVIILAGKSNKLSVQYIVLYSFCLSIMLVTGIFDHLVDVGWAQFYYILPIGIFINYVMFSLIPFYVRLRELFARGDTYELDKKWRTFVEESNLIVVILNRMGHVEYINPYFLRLSGYKENEVVGKDWFEFFLPTEQHYDVQSAFIEILEFDFHSHYRNPILTRYQEQRMIDWHNVRLRNETDAVTGSISIGIDITEEHTELESIKRKFREAEDLILRLRQEGKIY